MKSDIGSFQNMTNEWENVLLNQSLRIDKINRCLEELFSHCWDLMSFSKVEHISIIDITIDGFAMKSEVSL